MATHQLLFQIPPLTLPCGLSIPIPFDFWTMLKACGVREVNIELCECGVAHQVEIPDMSRLEAQVAVITAQSPLTMPNLGLN